MSRSILGAIALFMALGGAGAGAKPAAAGAEPELLLSAFAGRIEVETVGVAEGVPGEKLPSLRSGSIVRVLAGSADFHSDVGATVHAGAGDAFYFAALKPEGGRPGYLRIAAIEEEPKALEVAVGGAAFRLSKGAGLSVAAAGPGEATVKQEWGAVRTGDRELKAGESVTLPVGEGRRFDRPAMSLAGVSVTRKNETTFEASGSGSAPSAGFVSRDAALRAVSRWPAFSKTVAEAMLEKYGAPDMLDGDSVRWNDNGSWKKTIVRRVPREGEDVLEQTISYDVPRDKRAALSKLDIMLKVNALDKELSATSESEETNFLALNLADEVVHDKRTPEDAREYYLTTVRLSHAGKASPYMSGLLFRP